MKQGGLTNGKSIQSVFSLSSLPGR